MTRMHVPPEYVLLAGPAKVIFQLTEPTKRRLAGPPRTSSLFSKGPGAVTPKFISARAVLARRIVFRVGTKPQRQPGDPAPDKRSDAPNSPQNPPANLVIEDLGRGPVCFAVHELEGGVSQLDHSFHKRIDAIQFEADIRGGCCRR